MEDGTMAVITTTLTRCGKTWSYGCYQLPIKHGDSLL